MKQGNFTLQAVRPLTGDVYELSLSGDASAVTAPGQFVNIALPGRFLRRPISVCHWTAEGITLLVKEAGAGTRELVGLAPGAVLDILTGLGNGFDLSVLDETGGGNRLGGTDTNGGNRTGGTDETGGGDRRTVSPDRIILAGGGIGIAPLYGLAKALAGRGIRPAAALGFRSAGDAFYVEAFAALGCHLSVATEDHSLGVRGTVMDLLSAQPERDYVFCCGPSPMLRAVHSLAHLTGGQFSFEARMGCGFGACMGCSLATAHGMRRVCADGPVFTREAIRWQD